MRSKALASLATIALGGLTALTGAAEAQQTVVLSTVQSNGMNGTFPTAQTIDNSGAGQTSLFNAALQAFNLRNAGTILQDASSLTPTGQAVSPVSFPYGSAAVPVNSVIDVVGSLSPLAPRSNFAFNELAGGAIRLLVSTRPTDQTAGLSLANSSGNVVAAADRNAPDGLSSVINYTDLLNQSPSWFATVSRDPSDTSALDYTLQIGAGLSAVSEFTTHILGNGTSNGSLLAAYDVNANSEDILHFDVHSKDPGSPTTELMLIDPEGNIAAMAQGNGSDGSSSVIDIPVLGNAGDWQVDVIEPFSTPYAYDLTLQGASGLGPAVFAAVPEPSTWAMMLLGLASLEFAGYRGARAKRSTTIA